MKVLEANQGRPYDSFKKGILERKLNNEYLHIILKNNDQELSSKDVVALLKSLKERGCTCAMFANLLGNYIVNQDMDSEEIERIFGFPLVDEEKGLIDLNKLMLDIYSKLYHKVKVKTISYDIYRFKSPNEAVKELFGIDIEDSNEALLYLFDNKIISDGKDGDLLRYKNANPNMSTYVDTYQNVTRLKESLEGTATEVEIKDLDISEKLSGLIANNFNFWTSYYLDSLDLPFRLKKDNFKPMTKEELFDYVYDAKDYFLEVSVGPNKDVFIHEQNKRNWTKISSEKEGHAMLFKGLDEENDIIVSSYGANYILPIDYISEISFSKIRIISKEEKEKTNKTK